MGENDKNETYSGQSTHIFGEVVPYLTNDQVQVPHVMTGTRFRCTSWKRQDMINVGDSVKMGQNVYTFLCILVRQHATSQRSFVVCCRYEPNSPAPRSSGLSTGRATATRNTSWSLVMQKVFFFLALKNSPALNQRWSPFPERYVFANVLPSRTNLLFLFSCI